MRGILPLAMALFLLGCGMRKEVKIPEPQRPPVRPPVHEPWSEGSLWTGEGRGNMFFVDRKARAVGDIVTVKIVEVNSAENSAKTETSRSSEVTMGINTFFGVPSHFGLDKVWSGGFKPEVKASGGSDFTGDGTTSRSVKFIATISCQVVEVLPNGNLVIEGVRQVRINREREFITLRGVVRPEDIGPDNTVLSTAIADAQIEYSGKGVISDNQGPGWFTRVLNLFWPF